MAQYIDKDDLVAEIERRNVICKKVALDLRTQENKDYYQGKAEAYKEMLDILDTLEVKKVDDEKCKEYDKALSIAKSWYKSSDSSAQERNVARMIMGDKVREEL